jgi:putative hydrolase of the HAD superfamily
VIRHVLLHVDPSSRELVRDLHEVGLGVHLAPNEEYDDLFDDPCHSRDLGAAKPDAAFFTTAVDRLGTTPPEVLFVDDHEPNVDAAREVGLAAEHWTVGDGIPRLHALLEGHGILF